MIPLYAIEDLCTDDVDALIEKGVVFDVGSKTSILPEADSDFERESFWGPRTIYKLSECWEFVVKTLHTLTVIGDVS